jgi:hypothetical protein
MRHLLTVVRRSLLGIVSVSEDSRPLLSRFPLSLLSFPALSIRRRLAGESDVFVVKLL